MDTSAPQPRTDSVLDEVTAEQKAAALEKTGRPEDLVRLCEQAGRDLPPLPAARWWVKAAELSRTRLRDLDRAEGDLRRACALDASGEALSALAGLLEQRQDLFAAAQICEQLAGLAQGAERARWLVKAADLYLARSVRRSRALLCLQLAAKANGEMSLLRRLRLALLEERRFASAIEVLDQERALGVEGLADVYAQIAEAVSDDPAAKPLVTRAAGAAEALAPGHALAAQAKAAAESLEKGWRDRARVLRQGALEERDRKTAAHRSLAVAKLHAHFEGTQSQGFRQSLERALLLWPAMGEALALIEGRDDAPAMLTQLAKDAKDKSAQADLWVRVGTAQVRREDRAAALDAFRRAAAIDPSREDASVLAAELQIEAGQVQEALELLDRHLSATKDRGTKASLHARLAEICHSVAKNDRLAVGYLEQWLLLEPQRPEAAFRLLEAKLALGETKNLEPLIELAAVAVRPASVRATLLAQAAERLAASGLDAVALGAWGAVLAIDPTWAGALDHIGALAAKGFDPAAALQRAARRHPAHATALLQAVQTVPVERGEPAPNEPKAPDAPTGAEAPAAAEPFPSGQTFSDSHQRDWQLQRAENFARDPERREDAARIYLTLFAQAPAVELFGTLEQLAREGVLRAEIAQALLAGAKALGDSNRTLSALELAISAGPTAALLREKARLLNEHLDGRGAIDALIAALELSPDDRELSDEIARLGRELSLQAEAARALVDSGNRQNARLAADLFEESQHFSEARSALEAALQGQDDPALLSRLAQLHARAGESDQAEAVLRRRILHAEGEEKAQLYLELAELNAGLARPKEAAQALAEAIRAGAKEGEHLPKMAELLEQGGRTRELVEVLERQVALAQQAGDTDAVARLSLKRAKLLEASLDNRLEAVRTYAEILDKNPADPEAVASLEKLLEDEVCREEAARSLLPAYEALKDHRKLVTALEVVAAHSPDSLEQVLALKRAAQVHLEHLRQPELAFASYARALKLAPADGSLRASARSAAEAADAIDSYAEVLGELSEKDIGTAKVAVLRELAEVEEKKLGNAAKATERLQSLLALDAKNVEALRTLVRLNRAGGDAAALCDALERLAEASDDNTEKVSTLKELAQLTEQNAPERATRALRKVVEIDPHDRDAAGTLDRLYAQLEQPSDLAFTLNVRIAQEGQSPQARELMLRLATLKREKLSDDAGALQTLGAILSADPAHAGALDALEAWARSEAPNGVTALETLDAALSTTGDHARRSSVREARLGFATGEERSRLAREVRDLQENKLGQPERAFLSGVQAFAQGIDREQLLPELERLAVRTGALDELAEVLESVGLDLPKDDVIAPGYIARAAELREGLNQAEDAVRLWNEVLGRVPKDPKALEALSKLYEKTKSAQNLADVFAQKAQLATDAREKRGLLVKAAHAQEDAGQDEKAAESYRAALAIQVVSDALEPLERVLGRLGRHADQVEVLAQLADRAVGEAREAFLLKRAQLLEKIGELSRAVAGFGSLLDISPANAQAIAGLERLMQIEASRSEAARKLEATFRRASDPRLVDVLEARYASESGEGRLGLLKEIATLREAHGQKPLAFATRLRAFAEAPQAPSIREELERLAAELGSFEELAGAYEDQLEKNPAEPLPTELYGRLANLYANRLNRPELAAKAYEELARRKPSDTKVLDALSELYRVNQKPRERAQVLQRQIAVEGAVAKQVHLLFDLAQLAEEALADKALAADSYRGVLERKPDDAEAVKQLDRVLSETERFPELAQLIEKEIALAEAARQPEESLSLKVRLGRLKFTRLDDGRAALELFEDVLSRRPGHPGAVGALEEMARSESPLRKEAASALEPVFAMGGDHLKLVEMLESRAAAEAHPKDKAELLRKVAALYAGPMENREMAFVAAARALREAPDDDAALALCLKLAKPAEATEELLALLEDVVEKAHEDGSRIGLLRALANLKAEEGDADGAAEALKGLLALSPTDADALERISGLLKKANRPAELLEILRRQLALAEDSAARAQLLLEIGTLQDESLEDGIGALATFRRLIEIKPDDAGALERMDFLCFRQERWPELADVIARRLALVDAKEGLELQFRLAQLKEQKLADREGALALYGQILTADPTHAATLEQVEATVRKDPGHAAAADLLLSAYRAAKNGTQLAEFIEMRVSVVEDRGEKKALLGELAGLREQQQEPELAFLAYWRAFKEDPNDSQLRQKLERAAEVAQSYEELAAVYEEELPRVAEPSETAEICLRLGQLCEKHLDEPQRAVSFYARAHEQAPTDSRPLSALERLYTSLDQADALATVLEKLIALTPDKVDKVSLGLRLGTLANERLGDPDRAAEAFEQVLALDGNQVVAARLLEPIYEAAAKMDRLYAVLEKQKEVASGPERERVLSKMAKVSAEGLADISHSIELLKELVEKNPRNDQAFHQLAEALEKAGRAGELQTLLETRVKKTVDPRELVKLNDRLGRLTWKSLKKPEEAIAFFKAALDRDARAKSSLEALRDLYEELGKKDELVAVLRRLLPLQEGPEGVKAIRLGIAESLSQLGRREEALDAARRAMEIEPHAVPDLNRVAKLFESLRAFADAARAIELRAEVELRLEEREQALATLFELADLWRGPASKPEAAGKVLERILELDPANKTAHEQACALYVQHNDWRAYAAALDRYLPQLVTEEEKVASLRDLAQVREQKLGNKPAAFLAYCRALETNPSDMSLHQEVERLAEETGSYEELAAVYEQVADALPRGPLAVEMYRVLARVQDEKLDEPAAAEATLRKILEFDATNQSALESLAQVFARRGRNKDYIIALEQKLEAAPTIEERKAVLREIARVYEEQVQDPTEAAGALLRALDLEPDTETLGTLAELYRRQQQFTELAGILARTRDLATTDADRTRIQFEVGQVYERDIGDDEAAIEAYGHALHFDAKNAAALEALERLYSKLDRPAELLAVYEREIELHEDPREKVSVLFKSAAIWEDKYQNLEHADACVQAALSFEPQNLQAVRTLERLRRAQGRFEELSHVLEHHLTLATDPVERAALYVELGELFHQELRHIDRAVDCFTQALDSDPSCKPAMHALGVLYERTGNWPFAIEMIQREAEALGQTSEAVELFFRAGRIQEEMLIDREAAKTAYQRALAIDEAHLPALRALKGIHESQQDWGAYEQTLLDEASKTEDPEAKAKAFLDVARHSESKKEDAAGAVHYYEEAIRLVPDLLEAARPLADAYVAREDWEKSERMLDIVCRKMAAQAIADSSGATSKELCRQLYRLGYVAEKLGKQDKALGAYEKAYALDATYLPALEGLGNQLVRAGRQEDALKVYGAILIHHREELTDLEVVEIYWQIGEVHRSLNQIDRAQNHYEKALAIDPGHEHSLRALISLADTHGKHDKSAEYRQKLAQVLDGDDKLAVFLELGQLAQKKLNDPYMAIDAYVGALKIDDANLAVLEGLHPLYKQTRQGQKAADILDRMLQLPEVMNDADKAKRTHFALGEIARDELKDLDRAITSFNAALDVEPRFIQAFSAIESLLGSQRQWKALEENYARMIQRLPKGEATNAARLALWRALGDLYLKVLKQPEAARMAYQVVAAAMPDDEAVNITYAELSAQVAGQEDAALEAYRRVLPKTRDAGKVLSAMAELFAKKKDYDGSYLAAQSVLAVNGKVGAGEQEILTKLAPYAKRKEQPTRALTDRLWQTQLFHPKARGPLGELLAILFEQTGHLWASTHVQHQVNPKKHRIDVSAAPEFQIHHYRTVAKALGMEGVELYSPFLIATRERMAKRSNEPAPEPLVGVELCHTHPICLKVGGKYFNEPDQKAVYYLVARSMALVRPELALTQRLAPQRLQAVIDAATVLSAPGARVQSHPDAIAQEQRALEKALPEASRTALARVVRDHLRAPKPLAEFLEGAELTALRTGLLLCGDVEVARKRVQEESGAQFRVSSAAKLRELVQFAVSDDCKALRAALGIQLEVAARR